MVTLLTRLFKVGPSLYEHKNTIFFDIFYHGIIPGRYDARIAVQTMRRPYFQAHVSGPRPRCSAPWMDVFVFKMDPFSEVEILWFNLLAGLLLASKA